MGAAFAKEIESKINPVATLPETRSPVQNGASGLHYSGRVYANQFQQLSSNICKGSASITQIGDVMPNSISTTTLATDPSTKRVSKPALQSYVQALIAKGQIPGQLQEFNKQMAADTAFYAKVQVEYCFYESRYSAALNHFLTLIADPNTPDTSATLAATVNLNKRLNSLLEIMNYVSDERANMVNTRSNKLNTVGQTLNQKIAILQSQQKFLQTGDVMRNTQDEMMRYSAEKSDATNIQIATFVALNIVAIGAVLTVYRQVKTTV
jgi:hypothetical protein